MILLPLAILLAASGPRPAPRAPEQFTVRVDSSRHEVILTAGPYDLPAGHAPAAGHGMAGMSMGDMSDMAMVSSGLLEFTWPVDGWAHGVKLRVFDQAGHPLSHRFIHHINIVNFARRQLFYSAPERMIALGQETEDVHLPATIGIPVASTMPMAMLLMWDNETPEPVHGAMVEMTVEYSPANLTPRPVSVMPVYMDVMNPVGHDVDFDLPAGVTSRSADFHLAVSGRIIGAGGHEHDYGTGITLFDITDGKPRSVMHLATKLDAAGALLSIQRALPGLTGDGVRMQAGRTYRMEGTYNNPTGKTLDKGAMIHMALLYAPDRGAQWPAVPAADSEYHKDVERLEALGIVHARMIRK
ncbi:MAG TPA: hypothetical protein VHW65_10305 [Gemmatimonadales bacterium]|jgi:hypothetical protein|nr:hypothetical protein [Gemmatimonadales bacterium]